MRYNWKIHNKDNEDKRIWYEGDDLTFVCIFMNTAKTGYHVCLQVNQRPITMNYEPFKSFEEAEEYAMHELTKFINDCTVIKSFLEEVE